MRESRRLLVGLLLSLALVVWAVPAAAEPVTAPDATSPAPEPESSPAPAPSPTVDTVPTERPDAAPAPRETGEVAPAPQRAAAVRAVAPETDDEDGQTGTSRTVEDAQLRWGLSHEANNRAFAPNTFNFFSAGRIPDPGRGGTSLPEGSWRQQAGDVRIEKFVGDAYRPATWAGLRTDSSGAPLGAPTSGTSSNHQVVVEGGEGVVDPADGSAEVRWEGSFTVVSYSGMSFFYVTDPVLTVEDGVGRLDATLGGFGSSMEDLDQWRPLPEATVRLADLGRLDLSSGKGFTATPAYKGVRVRTPADQSPQVTSGEHWGAFPQSFVDYQGRVGTASYWYSSGGAVDRFKAALPVTTSWSAAEAVDPVPPPSAGPGADTVENVVRQAPARADAPVPTSAPAFGAASAASAPPAAPTPLDVPVEEALTPASAPLPTSAQAGTLLAASLETSSLRWPWIAGGALLALAALVAASPLLRRARTSSPTP